MSENWKTATLSEFVKEFIVPQRDKPTTFGGEIPWCRIEDFEGPYLSASKSGKCVTTKSVAEMPLRVFPTNTVLVSCSANLGRCAITTRPLVTNQTFIGLVPKDDVDSKFLYYLMGSKSAVLNEMATGVTIRYLSREKFSNLIVSIPSLPEQQRIVRLLDKAFEGIAIAKANAEKNLRNARALFESHLQSIFTKSGNGWKNKALEEVCEFSNGLWKGEKPPFERVGVIRNTNFTKNGMLDDSDIAFLDVEVKKLEKRRLKYGDIILEKSGGGPKQAVGRVALFEKEAGAFSFSNFTAALRVLDSGTVDFRFLHKFLYWTYLSGATESMQSNSTGIRNLDGGAYKSIRFKFPPLAEQQQIASLLDDLQVITDALARICTTKQALLEDLKESLLHQAFSGNLEAA